jgi:putative phosphoesterase
VLPGSFPGFPDADDSGRWDETLVRIGLISDIHGDFLALARAWSHLEAQGVDRVLCAGDSVGYGPDPDRTVAFLAERCAMSVRGNHDRWAVERGAGHADPLGGGTPSAATHAYLRTIPPLRIMPVSDRLITLIHGTPGSDMEYMVPSRFGPDRLAAILDELETEVLVVGHTHVPMWFRCERGLVVNPGSVLCVGTVRSSRTFAVVDVVQLTVSFHSAVTGRALEVSPWAGVVERAS